jgi:homocysteine S-methyltransferase
LTNDAKAFHSRQIDHLVHTGVDFLLGASPTTVPEATGMALATAETGVPFIISFVINRHGEIPDGHSLERAFGEWERRSKTRPVPMMVMGVVQ